jgi:hypothetical protein
MGTTIIEDGPGRITIHRDGETYSGFTTGIPTNSFTIRKLAGRSRESGFLVQSNGVFTWKPLGLVEHAGLMYVYGPQAPGIFLDQALSDTTRDRLADVTRIADALTALDERDELPPQIHTQCVVLLDEGGSLVLPADVVRAIREHQDIGEQLRTVERFTHPDRDGTENVGFFLATLTYHVLTDRFPFEAESAEELHSRIRGGKPVDPRFYRHSLNPRVAAALIGTLDGSRYEADASAWAEKLREWAANGVDIELSAEERQKLEQEAQEHVEKLDRAFRRKEFVRKYWKTALLIAAIAAVVGIVPGTIVRNALKPRVTAGFTPAEVVTAFYTSINSLDHMTMEDTVIDGAGRGTIREVMNLFVIDRQRMSVELQSGFVDAQAWRDAGMPVLENGASPYGVANLTIESQPAPEGEQRFTATYERWRPAFADEPPESNTAPSGPGYAGSMVTDDVRLRLDGEDWVIYSIETLSSEPLDLSQLRGSRALPSTG